MACGTPTICADSTSLPEVAGEGNALFFNPTDGEALAGHMTKLATSDELRQSLIQKGLVRAKEFDWRRTAIETLNVLQTW
jgi:glycosyltransferase involved in cell wall biosynthesis